MSDQEIEDDDNDEDWEDVEERNMFRKSRKRNLNQVKID